MYWNGQPCINEWLNGRVRLEKCKQLLEYQNLILFSEIWWFNSNIKWFVVYFSVFSHLWQLKTAVFLHRCLIHSVLFTAKKFYSLIASFNNKLNMDIAEVQWLEWNGLPLEYSVKRCLHYGKKHSKWGFLYFFLSFKDN